MKTAIEQYPNYKKFDRILSSMGRMVAKYYPKSQCQKEVFVRRTIEKLVRGKTFKICRKIGIGCYTYEDDSYDGKEIKIDVIEYVYITALNFALGYGDNMVVYYYKPDSIIMQREEISYNNILSFKIEEDFEVFDKIQSYYKVTE